MEQIKKSFLEYITWTRERHDREEKAANKKKKETQGGRERERDRE